MDSTTDTKSPPAFFSEPPPQQHPEFPSEAPPPSYEQAHAPPKAQGKYAFGEIPRPLHLTSDASPTYTDPPPGKAVQTLCLSREREKSMWKWPNAEYPVFNQHTNTVFLKGHDDGYKQGKVFRDLNDRHVMTVRRQKLSMWRKWNVMLPAEGTQGDSMVNGEYSTTAPANEQSYFEIKWHWSMKARLSATFKNHAAVPSPVPDMGDKKVRSKSTPGDDSSGKEVTLDAESDMYVNLIKITWNGTLVARARKAAMWPTEDGPPKRSEAGYEMEIVAGVDSRIILAICTVVDEAMQMMWGCSYNSSLAASSASSASAAAAAGA